MILVERRKTRVKRNYICGVRAIVYSLIFSFCIGCTGRDKNQLKEGAWRGVLFPDTADASLELPFNFELKKKDTSYTITILNAEERIEVEEVSLLGDSVFIRMPVFDSEFKCRLSDDSLNGVWINHGRKNKNTLVFKACHNQYNRFALMKENEAGNAFDGKWEAEFSPGTKDAYKAIGVFSKMDEIALKGTFLTETGDYRYLQGLSKKEEMWLSCFDGAHAFLFRAKLQHDGTLQGDFWSGRHWHEQWTARRNDTFQLRNPDSLTYLKPGYDKFDFTGKSLEGKDVTFGDEKFRNKVVILQVTGSWCPNCMDESRFYGDLYRKYNDQGLEIVGLSFERTSDFNRAVANVKRMKEKLNAGYEFLITGKTGKDQASEALPMLNGIMSFPTSIFIDKKGNVRKIYTGFNGPATGKLYEELVKETTAFVEQLLKE